MKNILIVGGTSGIGNAIAKQLNSDHQLFISGRKSHNLDGMDANFIQWNSNDDFETSTTPRNNTWPGILSRNN